MRLRLVALLAATLWVGCATTPTAPPAPPPPPPLSPEAAAVFARAEAPGPGAAVMVNLDALEDLGLTPKGPTLHQLAGLSATFLSQLAATESSDARLMARGAVVSALLREWAKWPHVRRFGFLVPSEKFIQRGPDVLPQTAVGALAVDEGTTDNAQLLAGVMSLLRAVTEELSQEGAQVHIALRGKDLCLEDAELGLPLCVRPRPGLILFGSPPALSAFEALPPVAAPVAAPGEPPVLLSLRVDMGARGHGRLAFTGRDAVRLSLSLEGGSPRDIAALEAVVKKAVTEYDSHRQNVRESVAAGLAEVQRSIAEDATAPASLKQAATTLTADQVVDAHGYWAQLRQSLQVSSTQSQFSLALTVPAGAVKDVSEALSSSGVPLAVMGSLAAVAIPNFMKFQGRSKQAEARANLKSAYIAQRIYFQERDKWGRTFEDIGFAPEKGRRYTYCMGKQCLPCDAEGCKVSAPPSPCQGLTSVGQGARDGFSICAYANLDSDDTWDVWVVDQNGEPQNLSNDLE